MRIIAALHADASLLSSSGTASKHVHLLNAEGKLHIDCNVCVCVCVLCQSVSAVLRMSGRSEQKVDRRRRVGAGQTVFNRCMMGLGVGFDVEAT